MTRTAFLLDTAPNGPLRGDVYLPEHPLGAPIIVGCHGFKGFKDWGFWPETGRRLAEAGFVLVTFNVSGAGVGADADRFTDLEGFAANTLSKELQDLGAVLDAISRRELSLGGADGRRLGVLGHSRGGAMALVRASRDPRIRSLVTWASVADFHRVDEETRRTWRETGYIEVPNLRTGQILRLSVSFLDDLEAHGDALNPVEAARRLKIPYLIVHGADDETVPVQEAERLARAADPGLRRLHIVRGSGHTFGAAHPFTTPTLDLAAVWDETIRWFRETLAGPVALS
jgi:dipeptidyl aminopeptidase/acylaminoacyl peptidase